MEKKKKNAFLTLQDRNREQLEAMDDMDRGFMMRGAMNLFNQGGEGRIR